MSLRYSLLGFLSIQPGTGYTIHKMYPKAVRPTLAAIYRALSGMAREGMVTSTSVVEEKKPLRNVFSITKKGLAVLDDWLGSPLKYEFPMPSVFGQLWYGGRCSRDTLIASIGGYRDQIKAFRDYVLSRPQDQALSMHNGRTKKVRDNRLGELTFRSVVRYLQREIDFYNSVIKELKELPEDEFPTVNKKR